MDELDRIERHIDIEADAERVWALVSRPGWWINEGQVLSNPVLEPRGGHDLLRDPVHGDFRIRTELLDPPRYAAFRWLPTEADADEGGPSTLVEFRIEDRTGGVRLSVVESGFSTLSEDRETWLRQREENVGGWETELDAARTHLDPVTVARSVHVGVPPERVWPFLVEPARLALWYAFDGADVEPVPGGAIELRWAEHGAFRGRVVSLTPQEAFVFRLAVRPDTEPDDGVATLVELTLRPAGDGGSVLTVRQSGYSALDPALGTTADLVAEDRQGWEAGLSLLPGLVGSPAEAGSR